MDTLHKAATNIQRITRGHITRINKWNYIQVEAFIPDFFDPNGRVSTPHSRKRLSYTQILFRIALNHPY